MKKLSVIFLSLLLTYAGAAWALDACLRHDDHSDHAPPEQPSDSHALVDHDASQEPPVFVIHCTSVTYQVGPAARIAAAEIPRADKGVARDMVSFPYTASATLKNALRFDAVFKRIVTISLPIELARHLFLSILQI